MQLNKWGIRLVLGTVMLTGVLACRLSDDFLAQAPATPTRTRTPRPTFTPIPPTLTPVPPSPTPIPPTATRPPTARPSLVPTRVPTKPPVVPTAVPPPPGPTTSPFEWHVNPPGCEHSGNVYIKARVYGDKNNPDSGVEGMRVVIGDKSGNRFDLPPVLTTWDGTYTFTLSTQGSPPYKGTVYVWLVDSGGRRISDIGGPINFNGLPPDGINTCWHGWVDFWR